MYFNKINVCNTLVKMNYTCRDFNPQIKENKCPQETLYSKQDDVSITLNYD